MATDSSLTRFNYSFTLNWRLMLLALFAVMLFIYLGVWQLQRADEKKRLLVAEQALANQTPIFWQKGDKLPQQFQPLSVEGHYLPDLFLLDNQHYQHRFGYHVISPFELSGRGIILIDRGWVQGDITRQTLPVIQTPETTLRISGKAYYPSPKNWVLGDVLEHKSAKTAVVERIDTNMISQFLHKSVYPFIIRLNENDAFGYIRQWMTVSMLPERHYAYAIQWFIFAIVVLILFFALNIKKRNENNSP